MKEIGIIGWRGMVGSVLLDRMQAENDFAKINVTLFSTSQYGLTNPIAAIQTKTIQNAYDLAALMAMDILISCQGSEYTQTIHQQLRAHHWQGYWIDAASLLRMQADSVIVLDPLNENIIQQALTAEVKNYIGGNCTVSLMLMALDGLIKRDLIDWISAMTYQAASGAGAANMIELLKQSAVINEKTSEELNSSHPNALKLADIVQRNYAENDFPKAAFQFPLAYNLLPWIDGTNDVGHSKEEWKAEVEANKILQSKDPLIIDGLCVRVPVLRCHSQALTIKLKKGINVSEVADILQSANPWVKYIDNEPELSKQLLTPAAVSGTLDVAVGRLRNLKMGPEYFSLFTVGDQLLWGAAEPLRRVLQIILKFLAN